MSDVAGKALHLLLLPGEGFSWRYQPWNLTFSLLLSGFHLFKSNLYKIHIVD